MILKAHFYPQIKNDIFPLACSAVSASICIILVNSSVVEISVMKFSA